MTLPSTDILTHDLLDYIVCLQRQADRLSERVHELEMQNVVLDFQDRCKDCPYADHDADECVAFLDFEPYKTYMISCKNRDICNRLYNFYKGFNEDQ